jgi:hypothetical protein
MNTGVAFPSAAARPAPVMVWLREIKRSCTLCATGSAPLVVRLAAKVKRREKAVLDLISLEPAHGGHLESAAKGMVDQ